MLRAFHIFALVGTVLLSACANSVSTLPDHRSGGPISSSVRSAVGSQPNVNLVQNGSFERPSVPSGSFTLFSTGTTFAHWKVVGASGNVAEVSGTFTQNGFTFPAACGLQWLDLTGTTNTPTGVQQVVATTAGTQHTLSFKVGNVVNPNGIFGTSSTVDVLINGSQVLAATNSRGAGQTKLVWKLFTIGFTAQGSTTTIAFMNGDPSSDTNNGLDCVNVQ